MPAAQLKPFRRLPSSPNLKHLKSQAAQLLDDFRQGDPDAVLRIQASATGQTAKVPEASDLEVGLQRCQHVIASEYGFSDWSALLKKVTTGHNTYDQYAERYARLVPASDEDVSQDYALQDLLRIVGDPEGLVVLDAGCGEGLVGRLLAVRGARVTGIDISPKLVDIAQSKDDTESIDYRVHDLSQPLPEYERSFDLVVSRMVLNDVPDYRGFIARLGEVTRMAGRVVLSMNNPYSAVHREKVVDYFDSGVSIVYYGMASTTGLDARDPYRRSKAESVGPRGCWGRRG